MKHLSTGIHVAVVVLAAACVSAGCRGSGERPEQARTSAAKPSILLVTLDTTRADAIGPDANGISTPAFNALAARGRRFRQAYATVPETLPSHSSMMTGLYPAGHGVHENARFLSPGHPVAGGATEVRGVSDERVRVVVRAVAPLRPRARLRCLRRRAAGRGRGARSEGDDRSRAGRPRHAGRPARCSSGCTTSIRIRRMRPPSRFAPSSPSGRTSARSRRWTQQLGRLVQAFEEHVAAGGGSAAIVVVSDHGEGLGDHGESAARPPAVSVDDARAAGDGRSGRARLTRSTSPSARGRIFHTILDWAGLDAANSLRAAGGSPAEVVLGEAMKPFLSTAGSRRSWRWPGGRRRSSPARRRCTTSPAIRPRRRTSDRARTFQRACGRRSTTTRCRRRTRRGHPRR